jgi:alkaline phosphatase
MSYTIDRVPTEEPSLAEMTEVALKTLHRHSKSSKGFFLLIEGSRIDMASHSNDPAAHVHDVLAYNDAFHVARKFIDKVGGVLISTSDHETGGISIGRQLTPAYPEYVWYPEVLANVSHSTEYLGRHLAWMANDTNVRAYIEETIVKEGLGIYDASEEEIDQLMKVRSSAVRADFTMADMVSRRAEIGVRSLVMKLM